MLFCLRSYSPLHSVPLYFTTFIYHYMYYEVNNFFIFPGMSFGAISCAAKTIPENFFMVAAEAVAQSLDEHDLGLESVVPSPSRIRAVSEHVATAVVLAAQEQGLAGKTVGSSAAEVKAALKKMMWNPDPVTYFAPSRLLAKAESPNSTILDKLDKLDKLDACDPTHPIGLD